MGLLIILPLFLPHPPPPPPQHTARARMHVGGAHLDGQRRQNGLGVHQLRLACASARSRSLLLSSCTHHSASTLTHASSAGSRGGGGGTQVVQPLGRKDDGAGLQHRTPCLARSTHRESSHLNSSCHLARNQRDCSSIPFYVWGWIHSGTGKQGEMAIVCLA